ncbi:hypothetical protein GCM10009090_10450 [[Pseudomonas] boreopolis]|uniref:Uncharacterized protein n=1 Tax=Xanthomonas boreopolis TaxID=86183 RepID=A0A919F645_9XANT|nr:hypothetical protein GCM10009090_10450 [[Pseudomonas] boreopolis]
MGRGLLSSPAERGGGLRHGLALWGGGQRAARVSGQVEAGPDGPAELGGGPESGRKVDTGLETPPECVRLTFSLAGGPDRDLRQARDGFRQAGRPA